MATGLQASNSNNFDVVRLLEGETAACAPVEAAVLSAMNRGADSMDVLDLLLGAQEYHRADPALRALQALSPLAAKGDRH